MEIINPAGAEAIPCGDMRLSSPQQLSQGDIPMKTISLFVLILAAAFTSGCSTIDRQAFCAGAGASGNLAITAFCGINSAVTLAQHLNRKSGTESAQHEDETSAATETEKPSKNNQ
jgi:hypothetical protein